ncbi:MAG TPA: dioxygenase, partial [Alicycliphilus sp.]|nr:dioxygenase [Alicycliphilus sp.]
MRNINEHTITDAVLARMDGCDNPRFKRVMSSLIRHLHDFAREVHLTEAEWEEGVRFLTATGQMCDDKRQEFILLSDTLGLSMLNVAQNHSHGKGITEATVFGPFHVGGAPQYQLGDDIANGAPGEVLYVTATVRSADGSPISNASVDTWQADEDGFYDVQVPGAPLRGRGILRTDAEGRVYFRSILPTAYPIPTDGPVGQMLTLMGRHPWRPAHVHFLIQAAGFETLVTHVFRDDDPYLESDAVFGVRTSL